MAKDQTKAACFTFDERNRVEVRQVNLEGSVIELFPMMKYDLPTKESASTAEIITQTCTLDVAKRFDDIIYFYVESKYWVKLLPHERDKFRNTMIEYIKRYTTDFKQPQIAGGWGLINFVT